MHSQCITRLFSEAKGVVFEMLFKLKRGDWRVQYTRCFLHNSKPIIILYMMWCVVSSVVNFLLGDYLFQISPDVLMGLHYIAQGLLAHSLHYSYIPPPLSPAPLFPPFPFSPFSPAPLFPPFTLPSLNLFPFLPPSLPLSLQKLQRSTTQQVLRGTLRWCLPETSLRSAASCQESRPCSRWPCSYRGSKTSQDTLGMIH